MLKKLSMASSKGGSDGASNVDAIPGLAPSTKSDAPSQSNKTSTAVPGQKRSASQISNKTDIIAAPMPPGPSAFNRFSIRLSGGGRRVRVGVVGTGNYGLALTRCLVGAGFPVTLGSRFPEKRRAQLPLEADYLQLVDIADIETCLASASLIFIALHPEAFGDTLGQFTEETKGKILVDVSNREDRYVPLSNAERLAQLLPQALVVKAFNAVPAFVLESADCKSHYQVRVASNHIASRLEVLELAKHLGFSTADLGHLKAARYMEDQVVELFTPWIRPMMLCLLIFMGWAFFVTYLSYIRKSQFNWEQIFYKVLNKPLCMTSITMLTLTYLPSQIAAIVQVWRGTKHRRFPRLLDAWLRSRKQLGLLAYLLAATHTLMASTMISPTYYKSWYHQATVTLPKDMTNVSGKILEVSTTWMNWKGEAACLAGTIAFVLLTFVALTSIPSIAERLNYSEWIFINSTIGWSALFMTTAHVIIMGIPWWIKSPSTVHLSITFTSGFPAFIALALKLLFSLPTPLKWQLYRIRRGWERASAAAEGDLGVTGQTLSGAILAAGAVHAAADPDSETPSLFNHNENDNKSNHARSKETPSLFNHNENDNKSKNVGNKETPSLFNHKDNDNKSNQVRNKEAPSIFNHNDNDNKSNCVRNKDVSNSVV